MKPALLIAAQPASRRIAPGTTATLSVSASGTAPLAYQWYHVTELRDRIDALRVRFGLAAFAWTDPAAGSTAIRAQHVADLRAALSQAYTAAGRPLPTYSDPTPTAGVTVIRASDIAEIREAVEAIE